MDTVDPLERLATLARTERIPHCSVSADVVARLRRSEPAPVLSMRWFALASAAAAVIALLAVATLVTSSDGSNTLLAMFGEYELFLL